MLTKVSTEWDGKPRTLVAKQCEQCHNEYWSPLHRRSRFCSRQCGGAFVHQQRTSEVICTQCGTKFLKKKSSLKNSKSGLYFCNRNCKNTAQRIGGVSEIMPDHFGTGVSVYRDIAFRAYGKKCNRCGYEEVVQILQVHHKDRNRKNSDPANLEVLCPNCHMIEHLGCGAA